MIGIVLPLLAAGAQAAELKVYSSTAVKAVLEELGPQFEKATGDKLVFTFGLSSAVKMSSETSCAAGSACANMFPRQPGVGSTCAEP